MIVEIPAPDVTYMIHHGLGIAVSFGVAIIGTGCLASVSSRFRYDKTTNHGLVVLGLVGSSCFALF
jgi:hypothetical protein